MDKNTAIIEYLLTCPYIEPYKMFFNFGNAKDNNKMLISEATETMTDKKYIDGSVRKLYRFTIFDFKSVGYNAIITQDGYADENVSDLFEVQTILDWLTEQENLHNYPNFGDKCVIEKMYAQQNVPELDGVDTSVSPAIARYSITVTIEYIDETNAIWT